MALLALPLMAGCAVLGGGKEPPDTYVLTVPDRIEVAGATSAQILVQEPTAIKALDSERVVIRTSPYAIQFLDQSQWADRLPKIVQSRLVEAYEASGKVGAVGKPGEGLAIDAQIVTTIRMFEVVAYGTQQAMIELSVKAINDRNGVEIDSRVFRASAPVLREGNEAYIAAIDVAFDTLTRDIVAWTLQTI